MSLDLPKHWRWRSEPWAPAPTVVFDIDGVLSDASGRQPFLEGPGRKDWKGFFDACDADPLIEEMARLTELIDPSAVVVLLPGRPLRVQQKTLDWLGRHPVRWDLLIMRPSGDYTAATEFKRLSAQQLRARGFDLRLAIEDETRNRDMFREEGVPCIFIDSGYYP